MTGRGMKTGFVSETWIAAYCHSCGQAAHGGDEGAGPALFSSVDKAIEFVTFCGWQTDGDRITCEACYLIARCEEHGHDWVSWPPPGDGQPYQFRTCNHCYLCERER